MLCTVVLHGALAVRFGTSFELDVRSPVEAFRALIAQVKGFRRALRDGHYRVIRSRETVAESLSLDELKLRLGRGRTLHVVPVLAGSASGWGKVLAGVAIVGLAVVAPYALGFAGSIGAGLSTSMIGISGVATFGQLAGFGAMIALGGISQVLAPSPKAGKGAEDRRESFLFGSAENVTAQGGPVPVVFGEFVVGSVVISSGLSTEEMTAGSSSVATAVFSALTRSK